MKKALNYGLKLKNVHRVIKFNQRAWLKPYININTELKENTKNEFQKNFFKLMNNSVYGKTMENVRYRDIKLVKSDKRRKRLVSEPNYHSHKIFFRIFNGNRHEKDKNKNESAHISWNVNIRYISKILMYEFWYTRFFL